METELPMCALPEAHRHNLSFLREMERVQDNIVNLLKSVNYLCLDAIPLVLYDPVLSMTTLDVRRRFNPGEWVRDDALLMIEAWKEDRWCKTGAELGKVDWLVYAKSRGLEISSEIICKGARKGHLHIVQWWWDNMSEGVWSPNIFSQAVRSRSVPLMKWMREKGCPWTQQDFEIAVRTENMEVIRWLTEEGYSWYKDIVTVHSAVRTKNMEVIQWVVEHGWPVVGYSLLTTAARTGDMDVMQYLRGKGCHWCFTTFLAAVRSQSLNMIRYVREEGCPLGDTDEILDVIVNHDDVDAIGCIPANEPELDDLFDRATKKGKMGIMQWCMETEHRSFVMRPRHCLEGIRLGRLDVLQWLKQNGCPWVKKTCLECATRMGRPELVDFIKAFRPKRKK
jgi:hypothetical protein